MPARRNFRINPRVLVACVMGVMLVLGLVLVAQGFIDTHNYRDDIASIIKERTGKDVTIRGKVSISLLPMPTIYVPGLDLHESGGGAPTPSLSVDMVRLSVPVTEIFAAHPRISGIALEHPVLDLTRAQDNLIHWDWLNVKLLQALTGDSNGGAFSVIIEDGNIAYHDNLSDKGITIASIDATARRDQNFAAKGAFTTSGHHLHFSLDAGSANNAMPFDLQLFADGKNTLHLKGNADLAAENPVLNANLAVDLEDALSWVEVKTKSEAKKQFFEQVPGQTPAVQTDVQKALPFKFSADWAQTGLSVALNNAQLQGLNSEGTGSLTWSWNGPQPALAAQMHFKALDYNQWQTLLAAALDDKSATAATNPYHNGDDTPENPIPAGFHLSVSFTADQMFYGSQIWKDAALTADLADGAITVNRFTIGLPGETALNLFGIVSQGATGGLRFEGSMETQGKSLRDMLTAFDPSAADLPETGLGNFYAHSNIFVSAEQMRLSEADVKLNDLRLNGGLVAYYDANPRLEADVKLKDINFDYFRDVWREKQQAETAQTKDFFLKFDNGMNFNWLKKLRTSVDLKVSVDGFTFLERKGGNASFRLFARQDEVGIYDMHFYYPDESMEASFALSVKGGKPFINIMLNAGQIDTGYFNPTPEPAADAAPAPAPETDSKAWSEKLIDMSWMNGFSGAFDISIARLIHDKLSLGNVKVQAKLDNDMLTFQNFNFNYWQARWSVLGSLYGGKVPGISLSFTMYNAELLDMLKELAGRENISGRASVSGTITASGVNPQSWVAQSEAKLVLAARGVAVENLNLPGVTGAVAISRTAADVFNNVNLALIDGSTTFAVDGNLNIHNGVMRTPGITLKTDAITGDLTGEVRLVPWTMDLSTLFQFPAMTSETIPTLTVQLSGPVNSPQLKTDTSSLESYVAKRIISR